MSLENAKPKILGADTHSADLTGSLTKSVGTTVGTVGSQDGLSGGDTSDHLVGTITVTVVEALNLVILRFSAYTTNDSDIEIREGANVIATINGGSSGVKTINHVLEDVSVGAHSYDCYTLFDTQFYQYGAGDLVFYGAPVDIDDTHSADLTGANTQETHEDKVLP